MRSDAGKIRRKKLKQKRVALAIVSDEYAYGRELIKGIIDYYRKHSIWEIYRNELLQLFVPLDDLIEWKGNGVIAEIYTADDAVGVAALPVPFVNVSSSELASDMPSVGVDERAIGRMAAKHLVECKLDRFAFVGTLGLYYVRERYEGFSGFLKESGIPCELIQYKTKPRQHLHVSEDVLTPEMLTDSISKLDFPIGIMAATDRVGFVVLEACRKLGLRSPEDVALIGVDNDEVYCNLAYTSMTSIDPQAREVGFAAAALLDKLMDGKTPEKQKIIIPPKGIVARHSTDMTHSKYPEVASALRFIRNHAGEFIDVTSVLDVVPVSRRWLETKFKEEVGCGIYNEIRRIHIERAKELLATTDWLVSRIAKESGFNGVERFDVAFQKLVGMSATEYRKKATL